MRFARLLVCLVAVLALAASPMAVHAAPLPQQHADMDCSHHSPDGDHGAAKNLSHSCCPSMNAGWAVIAAGIVEPIATFVDRSPRASFVLSGVIPAKDPPRPRV
jgi:hypothetical protein